jgi:hypothetical protein
MAEVVDILALFDTLPAESNPRHLPLGDTTYRYAWTDDKRSDDWRADGYRWRNQGASKTMKKITTVRVTKTFFHVYDKPASWTNTLY